MQVGVELKMLLCVHRTTRCCCAYGKRASYTFDASTIGGWNPVVFCWVRRPFPKRIEIFSKLWLNLTDRGDLQQIDTFPESRCCFLCCLYEKSS